MTEKQKPKCGVNSSANNSECERIDHRHLSVTTEYT